MYRCLTLIAGFLLSHSSITAETVISANSDTGILSVGMGPTGSPVTRVSNLNTETGELFEHQVYTTRSPGSFTAMARSSSGVLYAVSEPNQLVTLNEETGIATTVAYLSDTEAGPFAIPKVPAMTFVDGVLYAIIKRNEFLPSLESEDETLPSIDTGFILVTIDTGTGAITGTGIYIGGQTDGEAHGLAHDSNLGLVHFYNDLGSTPMVEIIDVGSGTSISANHGGPPTADLPGGFQGCVATGGGTFLVYDNSDEEDFFTLTITSLAASGVDPDPEFQFTATLLGTADVDRVRAMELTSDSTGIVVEEDGFLERKTLTGAPTMTESVVTSLGGFPLFFESLITQPGTGRIYGFVGPDRRKRRRRLDSPGDPGSTGIGLVEVIRNGTEKVEVIGLDHEFFEPSEEGISPYSVETVAFDDRGRLFCFSQGDINPQLGEVNLSTGEISETAQFPDLPYGNSYQLEYNPEDGNFYLLFWNERDDELAFFQLTRTGTATRIMLNGDILSTNPASLVYVGLGKFIFTIPFFVGDAIFEVDTTGNVTALSEEILPACDCLDSSFITNGLAQAGILATADVSIGTKRSRLRGDNTYNRSGRGQTIKVKKTARRLKGQYFAKIENDGNYPGLVSLYGSKGKGRKKIRYIVGGRNLTSTVARGGSIELAAGESKNVKVTLNRKRARNWKFTGKLALRYGSVTDLAKAKIQLKTKKKKNSSLKPSSLF
ncbi:MAG: hypothetical protein MI807_02085 [Verrucomicrobiales bacterium]|nr:hypothetical protein [Verrucomicrobiales bacterium]